VDDFEASLNRVLVEIFNYILKYEEMSLKKALGVQVTITEAHMIEVLGREENEGATVSKLASILNIAMPTATVAVRKLEKKGFAKKVPCEKDGRRTIISLTDLGKKIERVHLIFHERMVRNISAQLVASEKQVVLRVVKMLGDFFRMKVDE